MKKINKIFLSGLFVLASGFLITSCDKKEEPSGPVTPQSDDATIVIRPVEHATVTCSITSLKGKRGDKGTLTITPESENYRIESVYQNSIAELFHIDGDPYTYEFTLLRGENTFTIQMSDYIEIVQPDSPILGPDNEEIIPDGELTDPDPLPGHFANEKTIYLKDIAWWNKDAAGTTALVYNENKEPISSNQALGDLMSHLSYNAIGQFNYWSITVDADNASYIKFFRTDGAGSTDWGAQTDMLPLPSGDNNMYTLTSEDPVWFNDTHEYVQAVEGVYDPSNDPVLVDYGTYTVYLEAPTWWTELGEATYCHKFGESSTAWPGDKMELVETKDGFTYYKTTIDTLKYNKLIFDVDGDTFKTADLTLPTEEFGKDATIIATLPDVKGQSGVMSVTWSEYTE